MVDEGLPIALGAEEMSRRKDGGSQNLVFSSLQTTLDGVKERREISYWIDQDFANVRNLCVDCAASIAVRTANRLYKMPCVVTQKHFADHTKAVALYRRERNMTKAEIDRTKDANPPAVARLEMESVNARYGIFPSAEAAIAAAVHSSACEGRTVPPNEIEDLRRVVRGEISREDLIEKYVEETLAEQKARDCG